MAAKHVLGDVCEVVKRSDVFHIHPDNIEVVDGWNPRKDFTGEDELVASIKENGTVDLPPLLVRKTADKRLELVDGERRLRATRRAISEGAEIKSVPVLVTKRGTNEVDLFVLAVLANGSKPFTPTEEAAAFKRFVGWGVGVKAIAARMGKSVSHVRNRLELAEATPEVQAAVDAGEITIGQAQQIAKDSDGKVDRQRDALNKTKGKPKKPQLILSFKKGKIRQTGFIESECNALNEIFTDAGLLEKIGAAGFDPASLRISVKPAGGPDPNQKPLPLWEQEPDENGQYQCPQCGAKVDRADLCPDCREKAAADHRQNMVEDRAALSE